MQRFEFVETRRIGEKRNNRKYKIPLCPEVKGPIRIELAYFGTGSNPAVYKLFYWFIRDLAIFDWFIIGLR